MAIDFEINHPCAVPKHALVSVNRPCPLTRLGGGGPDRGRTEFRGGSAGPTVLHGEIGRRPLPGAVSHSDPYRVLHSMPVFVKSGSIVPIRTGKVTNDAQNPLTKATLTIVQGASGGYDLYEDNGTTTKASDSATTGIRYTENGSGHTLRIGPATGSFHRTGALPVRGPSRSSTPGPPKASRSTASPWVPAPTTDPQRRSVRGTPRPSGPGSVPDGLSEKQHGAAPRAGFRVEDEQTVDGAGHPVHRLGAGVLQR